ncbi:MAG: hypothetical protein ACI915_003467 [Gammaproteobacteria bacterium]|jgi:hypothetical protein
MASVTPINEVRVPEYNTNELNWHILKGGPEFDYLIDYSLALLGAEPDKGRIDFLVRWEPNAYCHFHRHLSDTTTLVLEGEHHIVDTNETETVHKIRRVGHYAHSAGGDLHMEYAGPDGTLVFFSMFAPDGRLFEILDRENNILTITTIDDIVSGRLVE